MITDQPFRDCPRKHSIAKAMAASSGLADPHSFQKSRVALSGGTLSAGSPARLLAARGGRRRRGSHHGIEIGTAANARCRLKRGIGGNRSSQFCSEMARPTGFEPMAPRLGIWCSILLSYGRPPAPLGGSARTGNQLSSSGGATGSGSGKTAMPSSTSSRASSSVALPWIASTSRSP